MTTFPFTKLISWKGWWRRGLIASELKVHHDAVTFHRQACELEQDNKEFTEALSEAETAIEVRAIDTQNHDTRPQTPIYLFHLG